MGIIAQFLKVLDLRSTVVIGLTLASTHLCLVLGLEASLPTGLIGVAIVFPIVFTINAAYRRREEALNYFASFKSQVVALFLIHRDWPPQDKTVHAARGRELVERLLEAVRRYFTETQKPEPDRLAEVYEIFSDFSRSHELMRAGGLQVAEVVRTNLCLQSSVMEFERMRNILLYRTPVALRAYSKIFLTVFPILFGPDFAFLAGKYFPAAGYAAAGFYALVMISLNNIQNALENPYDGIGEDDIRLDALETYRPLLLD